MEIAVLALGCFWGPEDKFSKINGIIKTKLDIVVAITQTHHTKKFAQDQQIMPK